MAAESELWDLIASGREGVLGTVKRGGLPQLSNVLYLPEPGGRTVRISTPADRLKARVLARDPRAVLHVTGDSFWAYAVAEGQATLTPAAAEPGDEILRTQHGAQPVRDRTQQLVAAGMTQGIVDLLELIEVDKQQCRQLVGAMRNRQQAPDLVAEIDPVGQSREFVVTRQMRDSGFRCAPFGNVFQQHDGAAAGHRLEGP